MNQDLLDLDSAEFALRESLFLIERTQYFITLYYVEVRVVVENFMQIEVFVSYVLLSSSVLHLPISIKRLPITITSLYNVYTYVPMEKVQHCI